MSYRDNEPKGAIFPGVAILLAMASLVGALVCIRQPASAVRVWVPAQSTSLSPGKTTTRCSPVRVGCDTNSI
ncbi:hypothetical protein [Rhizobium lentis]|uniref:hypothetical protein n=1 Tax=Rhizobium lentis TaxID=1138194 RepID=UPI001C832F99|nr:hypothetical protein [Rhizobium lentis]MBX4959767.1 hypothetical protein [Rhizobium lentis]MBX4975004.1 hypothetical protein [Rhizobium lentis]MBX4989763.1 hypothetical protein [Rhizobium lentis]MBX5008264.1 hypothetical protein [Rhizobium lentis]MBX5026964.1 hypothetical protein [Rhizobium lentis]